MRLMIPILICACALFAQHASTGGARGSSNTFTNHGNVLHPGITGSTGVAPPGTFGLGTLVGPGPGFTGGTVTPAGRGRGHRPGALALPYGYGFAGGYIGGYGYGPAYSPEPGAYDPIFGVYSPEAGAYPQQAQTPVVVINQNFQPEVVRPQIIDYTNSILPPPGQKYAPAPSGASPGASATGTSIDGDTPMILIAMKDHTIYPALAYWLQGDTLNYVMAGGTVNHVSLGQVDREMSLKLNAERRPDFRLP